LEETKSKEKRKQLEDEFKKLDVSNKIISDKIYEDRAKIELSLDMERHEENEKEILADFKRYNR